MGGHRPAKAVNLDLGGTDRNGQYLDSDGNRVYIGGFDSDGLGLGRYWGGDRADIGLSAARQSNAIQRNSRHVREFLISESP